MKESVLNPQHTEGPDQLLYALRKFRSFKDGSGETLSDEYIVVVFDKNGSIGAWNVRETMERLVTFVCDLCMVKSPGAF